MRNLTIKDDVGCMWGVLYSPGESLGIKLPGIIVLFLILWLYSQKLVYNPSCREKSLGYK